MPFNFKFDQTPNSSKNALCDNCRYAHIMKGSNNEKVTLCQRMSFGHVVVRMKVTECSHHAEINRQDLDQMERSAWILGTHKIVGLAGGRPEDDVKITWSKPDDRETKSP